MEHPWLLRKSDFSFLFLLSAYSVDAAPNIHSQPLCLCCVSMQACHWSSRENLAFGKLLLLIYGIAPTHALCSFLNDIFLSCLFQCPLCKNSEVESCLFSSAIDLGTTGKDVNFGFGLLQAEDAYLCLRDEVQCCGGIGADSASPAPTPPPYTPSPPTNAAPTNMWNTLPSAEMISVSISDSLSTVVLLCFETHFLSVQYFQTMYWSEYYISSFVSGELDSTTFLQKLLTVVATDVVFESSYIPVNASLSPLFESRQGVDDLLALYEYKKGFATITSTSDPEDIGAGPADGVLYYHQSHVGTFGGGSQVSWETNCKLTFDLTARKITDILLNVVDSTPIDQAYPTAI